MKKVTIVNKAIGKESDFFFEPKQEGLSRRQVELLKNNLSVSVKENGTLDYSKLKAYEGSRQLHVQPSLSMDPKGYYASIQVFYY